LNLAQNISQLKKEEQEIDKKLQKLKQLIPDAGYISIFLKQLVKTGKRTGIKILSIKPGKIEKYGNYEIFPVECHIIADQWKMVKFITYLETSTSFIRIENIEIKAKPEFLPNLSVFLKLNAYLFRGK